METLGYGRRAVVGEELITRRLVLGNVGLPWTGSVTLFNYVLPSIASRLPGLGLLLVAAPLYRSEMGECCLRVSVPAQIEMTHFTRKQTQGCRMGNDNGIVRDDNYHCNSFVCAGEVELQASIAGDCPV